MEYNINIKSAFEVLDIVKLKNDLNNKYIKVKITNQILLIWNDLLLHGAFSEGKPFALVNWIKINEKDSIPYSILYDCKTISPSWYNSINTQKIKNHFMMSVFENELLFRQIKK
jgi:hypothetical protein